MGRESTPPLSAGNATLHVEHAQHAHGAPHPVWPRPARHKHVIRAMRPAWLHLPVALGQRYQLHQRRKATTAAAED